MMIFTMNKVHVSKDFIENLIKLKKIKMFKEEHPTRYQLYSHLPPITKTIQVRRTTGGVMVSKVD